MKLHSKSSDLHNRQERGPARFVRQCGSVLVVVLWVSLGLVATTIYFAQTMSFELRASENRLAALTADEAIAGAARYVALVLAAATNGAVPESGSYFCEAVPVGDARFWLIGRPGDREVQPDQVFFGLIDEGRKLNLNTATAEGLLRLTNVDVQLAANIYDWRNTNGTLSADGDGPTVYSRFEPAYMCKNAPYDTVEELRLVYRTDLGILFGEDANLNGALDPSEADTNRNNHADAGIVDQLTVYSRAEHAG
jgi:type II secretory pathway component PulK